MEGSERAPRNTLNADRIVQGALELADGEGLAALTIRALAQRLGVKPMAIYHHFPNKDAILDGVVDVVFSQVRAPQPGKPWREQIRMRTCSVRDVMRRHPWALGLLESRSAPGPSTLLHLEAVMATFRADGFTIDQIALAFPLVDSYVYGFVLQELALPFEGPEETQAVANGFHDEISAEQFPTLHEFLVGHVMDASYEFGAQFERGLDLVLDGLERLVR